MVGMVIYIYVIAAALEAHEVIHVDASGKVSIQSDNREEEQRVMKLLHDADAYYRNYPEDREACIAKYKAVLRDVDMHPTVEERILLTLADLSVRASRQPTRVFPSVTARAVSREMNLRQALDCYSSIMDQNSDFERPVLVAVTSVSMGDVYIELGEVKSAIQSYMRARRVSLDASLLTEVPESGRRRELIANEALLRIASILRRPIRAQFREQLIREADVDKELISVLTVPTSAGATAPRRAFTDIVQALSFSLSSFVTVSAIVLMRRRVRRAQRQLRNLEPHFRQRREGVRHETSIWSSAATCLCVCNVGRCGRRSVDARSDSNIR